MHASRPVARGCRAYEGASSFVRPELERVDYMMPRDMHSSRGGNVSLSTPQ